MTYTSASRYKTPISIFLLSFIYYCILSAKSYTWMFVSGDSGDWLTASTIWFVPQPLGSPLYVFLGHLLNLFPGSLPIKMTIVLSCLPSAVTVTLVYLIVRKITRKELPSICCAATLLGAGVFLTQSTVLEQYSLATMFLVLAFYSHLHSHNHRTMFFLGLGTAVHIIILPITLIFLMTEYRHLKQWVKPTVLYAISGPLLYSYVLILMSQHTQPIMTGWLSWPSLKNYIFDISGNLVGTMSLFELPKRLYHVSALLLTSLGLAVIPLVYIAQNRISVRLAERRQHDPLYNHKM